MRSAAWLVREEGAIKAENYMKKCFAMKAPWLGYDTMWEHYTCLADP